MFIELCEVCSWNLKYSLLSLIKMKTKITDLRERGKKMNHKCEPTRNIITIRVNCVILRAELVFDLRAMNSVPTMVQ